MAAKSKKHEEDIVLTPDERLAIRLLNRVYKTEVSSVTIRAMFISVWQGNSREVIQTIFKQQNRKYLNTVDTIALEYMAKRTRYASQLEEPAQDKEYIEVVNDTPETDRQIQLSLFG